MFGRIEAYPGRTILPAHQHDCGQLIYASTGILRAHTPAGIWVAPAARAVWIPAYLEHEVHALTNVDLVNIKVRDPVGLFPTESCAIQVSPFLRELVFEIVATSGANSDAPLRLAMTVLLVRQVRAAPHSPLKLPMPRDARVLRICTEALADPLATRDLARLCGRHGVSERTLSRIFVRDCGMTFGNWRRNRDLIEALQRIGAGESIASVASAMGYNSPSAFSSMFRTVLGARPSQYFDAAGHVAVSVRGLAGSG